LQLVDKLNGHKFEKTDPEIDAKKKEEAKKAKAAADAKQEAKAVAKALKATEKAQGYWACKACTIHNAIMSSRQCETCGTAREKVTSSEGPNADTPNDSKKEIDLTLLNGVSACLLEAVKPELAPSEEWVSGGGGIDRELAMTTQIGDGKADDGGASKRSVLVLLPRLPRQLQAQACADLAKDSPEVLVGKRLEILAPRAAEDGHAPGSYRPGRNAGSLATGHYQVLSFMADRKQHLIAKSEGAGGVQGRGMCVGAKVRIRRGAESISDTSSGPMRRGNVGTVINTSEESVQVRYRDNRWHYQKRALELVPTRKTETGDDKPVDLACHLVDLSDQIFTVDPASPTVHINPLTVIAAPGTNLKACMACGASKELSAYAKFCYQTGRLLMTDCCVSHATASICYTAPHPHCCACFDFSAKVTGDGTDLGPQRHPHTICRPCMDMWCTSELREGGLAVHCPAYGCDRILQIRELKRSVVDE
jgi:hypothetical protein